MFGKTLRISTNTSTGVVVAKDSETYLMRVGVPKKARIVAKNQINLMRSQWCW